MGFSKECFLQKCIFLLISFQGVHSKSFFPRHFCKRFCILRYFCKGVISCGKGFFQRVLFPRFFCKVGYFFAMGFSKEFFCKAFLQRSFFFQNIFISYFSEKVFFQNIFSKKFFSNGFTKKIYLQGVLIFFQVFFQRRLNNHVQ